MEKEWIDNGDGTFTAEQGDSAWSLHEDASITPEEANNIVQSQYGPNYKGEDGEMKSNIDPGDVIDVCCSEKTENEQNKLDKQYEINTILEKIDANNKAIDSIWEVDRKDDSSTSSKLNKPEMKPYPGDPGGGFNAVKILESVKIGVRSYKRQKEIKKIEKQNDSLNKVRIILDPPVYYPIKG